MKGTNEETLYVFTAKDDKGNDFPLAQFKGKVVLVVNVASQCGFTPQYQGLEALYRELNGLPAPTPTKTETAPGAQPAEAPEPATAPEPGSAAADSGDPRDFTVLAFPCNQFAKQEPGNAEEIRNLCESKYQITFPLMEKVKVNGGDADPLWKWLKAHQKGILPAMGIRMIKWNFEKFLIGRDGKVVHDWVSTSTPEAIRPEIEAALKKAAPSN